VQRIWPVTLLSRARPRALDLAAANGGGGGVLFALLMFVVSHAWLVIVRKLDVSLGALLSYALQQAIFWGAFALIDARLPQRGMRFTWAALGTLYAALTAFDGFLMRMTSLPLREILPMLLASQNVIEGLREIGLKPWRLFVLFAALFSAMAAGGSLRLLLAQRMPQRRRTNLQVGCSFGCVGMLLGSFVIEQAHARDDDDYLYRGLHMPAYLQLYSTSADSVVIPLKQPVDQAQRARWLAQVSRARNPHHVLYVLLESFRADAVDPKVSPTLWALSQQALTYDAALAEATYTPLSWSVLLFDETAHDNIFGRHTARIEPEGSWLLAVMRKAGYEPHVSISTNLTYAKTRQRLFGNGRTGLDFFQAAADEGEDPSFKNDNDRNAVDHLLKFIAQHSWDEHPQFMLLQLDSTHYTYPFPETEALFKPYSENLALPRAIETAQQAELLHNRYSNAAHFVDAQLRRVIEGLKRAGVYDDMAIVLTADHGEGLLPGQQGHGAVSAATRHVPLMFKFPGVAAHHSSALVSHRDILPTLTEYLGIPLPEGALRGHPADAQASPAVVTIAPSGRFGQLATANYVIDLRLRFTPDSVTVTPSAADGRDHARTRDWLPLLASFLRNESPPTAAVTDAAGALSQRARAQPALEVKP
jgi:glucan phosphoethanolaminetransferase (alkaline phosphatase superfamily)